MAIAFDATGGAGSTVGTSVSWAHICTGSNLMLFAAAQAIANVLTTATYNGVAADGSYNLVISGTNVIKVFYWFNPSTGSNTVTVNASGSTTLSGLSDSYTGVAFTIDSQNSGTSPTSPITVSTTVVASNCWLLWFCGSVGTVTGSVTSNPGVKRNASGLTGFELDIGDSNATVGTGSQSEIITVPASVLTQIGAIVISIAPPSTITPLEIVLRRNY